MNRTLVTDADDPRLDQFRAIKGRAGRNDETFVAESELVLDRLLESAIVIRALLITPSRADRLDVQLVRAERQRGEPLDVFVADQRVVDSVVGFPLHRGVIALAERPEPRGVDATLTDTRTVLALENVTDPDNVGSLFRHAAGFGVDAVVLSGHCGDPLYRKAIRTSMGWTLAIPYVCLPLDGRSLHATLAGFGLTTVALTPEPRAEALLDVIAGFPDDTRVALLLGAEGPGLETATMDAADRCVRIPLSDGVDSLNVATAGAIALFALTSAHPSRLPRTRSTG
jgi:tRNA G18 (ribose-2'-O)-methylase SpoU